jgi:hypothetical protein
MSIFTVPVVLGRRSCSRMAQRRAYEPTSSRVSPNGLIIGHYERGGKSRLATPQWIRRVNAKRRARNA